jgi:hypothetical protein
MGRSIRRTVPAEDVRHLKPTRRSHELFGLRSLVGYSIEGAYNLGQVQPADMQIDGGRCRRPVSQQQLNMMEACSRFYEVGGKAVPFMPNSA